MPNLADVFTQTFRSFSPEALSDRLFKDPLESWWYTYQTKLENSGYDGPVQTAFFIATFASMGHVAKCDGRIKDVEVELATRVMQHLKLGEEQKKLAIRLFNEGKHGDFALEKLLWRFYRQCRHRVSVLQIFIEIQLQMAYSDAKLTERESQLIKFMCKRLDVSESIYTRIERRVRAEKKGPQQPVSKKMNKILSLEDAYKALGITRKAKHTDVKQAYRRMMSQNHPDKLVARGATDVEILEAQSITQEIKSAYDMLMKTRRGSK